MLSAEGAGLITATEASRAALFHLPISAASQVLSQVYQTLQLPMGPAGTALTQIQQTVAEAATNGGVGGQNWFTLAVSTVAVAAAVLSSMPKDDYEGYTSKLYEEDKVRGMS